jgi:histidinol-phosphate aminotransferase
VPYRPTPLRDDFLLDAADYLVENGGVILANPNAPTGVLLAHQDLPAIIEHQRRLHKTLIIDEAYIDFADTVSAASFINEYPNLLVIRTLSKSASLAGMRAGYALGGEALIDGLCRIRDSFNSYPLDRIAQAAGTAAVRCGGYYDKITRKIINTRERTAAALGANGWTVLPSQANFLFVKHKTISGRDVFRKLRESGILVRHFDRPRIADYVRVSIGTDEEMDRFLTIALAPE